jgi:hypothetical protein
MGWDGVVKKAKICSDENKTCICGLLYNTISQTKKH